MLLRAAFDLKCKDENGQESQVYTMLALTSPRTPFKHLGATMAFFK